MDPIILGLTIVLLCIAVEKWRSSKRRWHIDGVPIAPPVEHDFSPWWGHLGALYRMTRDRPLQMFDATEEFCRRSRHKIVALYPGPPGLVKPLYCILDPKEGRRLAADGEGSPLVEQALLVLFGEPVISTAHHLDERQRQRRKRILAAALLRPRRLQFMAEAACQQVGRFLAGGWLDADGGVFDAARRSFEPLVHATMLRTLLSVDGAGLPAGALAAYSRDMRTLGAGVRDMLVSPLSARLFPYVRPLAYRRLRAAYRACRDGVVRTAAERRLRDVAAGRSVPDDALTHVLNGNGDTGDTGAAADGDEDADADGGVEAMSLETLCAEVTGMLFASDTMINTILWFFLHMAHNPEIQEKCFDEIASVIGERVQPERPDMDDIGRMPYLHGTLKESQRLAPIAHGIFRQAHKNLVIGGHVLPAGADVIIPFYTEQRSAANFADASTLRPERWMDDPLAGGARDGKKTLTYAPFGHGSHQCFGKTLAQAEAKVICGLVMQSYRVEPVTSLADAAPVFETITYRPEKMLVRFVRRPRAAAA